MKSHIVIVLVLEAEKEKYNFSTLWSMKGAPPFDKPVIWIPLFVIALYQLLLLKNACKGGICLRASCLKVLAKWEELSLNCCGLFPSQ